MLENFSEIIKRCGLEEKGGWGTGGGEIFKTMMKITQNLHENERIRAKFEKKGSVKNV